MSGNAGNGSKDAHSRLTAIASHIAPSSISKNNSIRKYGDVVVLRYAGQEVVGARPPFELEDHPIDDHRNLKASKS